MDGSYSLEGWTKFHHLESKSAAHYLDPQVIYGLVVGFFPFGFFLMSGGGGGGNGGGVRVGLGKKETVP